LSYEPLDRIANGKGSSFSHCAFSLSIYSLCRSKLVHQHKEERMKGLLVRVGADQSEGGGYCNGPIDSQTCRFAYLPIPETGVLRVGLEKGYGNLQPTLERFGFTLPQHLANQKMHLDPDFDHLTYGDQGQRAFQISSKLGGGDLLVFYAGLADIHDSPRLVY